MRKPRKGITRHDKRTPIVSPEREKIGITALKGISILFEDDLYELACWLLKMNEAKNKGTNVRSRHSVYGLASVYATESRLNREDILRVLECHGVPLGAAIEYDKDL